MRILEIEKDHYGHNFMIEAMDITQQKLKYGDPGNWTDKTLYQRYLMKDELDAEFFKLIEAELKSRGGIESVRKAYEAELLAETERQHKKKRKKKILTYSLIAASMLLLAGFAYLMTTEGWHYWKARRASSIEPCQTYLSRHPDGEHRDEIYCKLKVLEMYKGHPMSSLEIDPDKPQDISRVFEDHEAYVREFNASCAEIIMNDPVVQKAFKEIFPEYSHELDQLNYYAIPVRDRLEKKYNLSRGLLVRGLAR